LAFERCALSVSPALSCQKGSGSALWEEIAAALPEDIGWRRRGIAYLAETEAELEPPTVLTTPRRF
jgi:hypothetical protein